MLLFNANGMDSSTPEALDESTSSSDAADVLIRSTALPFRGQAISENRSVRCISIKPGHDGGVNISVKRLREGALPSMQVTTKTALGQEPAYVPPALPANKPQASSSEVRKAPPSNKAKVPSGDREVKNGSEEEVICKPSSARVKKSLPHSKPQGGSMLKGQDVLISQYSGNKEAVRAVLKQRSASAPLMREVKVQLLNRPASAAHSPEGPQAPGQPTEPQPAGPSTGDQGPSAAALTAAALTVTAPLLKAQSELDSRLARFSEDLQRLQAGYGQVLRPPDDRSRALEQQLDTLTQQRLQHLERIQQQQLELQNRLLGSALDAVGARVPGPVGQASAVPGLQVTSAPHTRSAESPGSLAPHTAGAKPGAGDLSQRLGRGKRGPQATPSPRRFAPKPMSQNARAPNAKERLVADGRRAPCAAGGSVRLLEDILNSSKSPESTAQTAGGKKVTIATAVCQPEPSSTGAPEQPSVTARKPSCEHLCLGHTLRDAASDPSSVMERASGMLQDLGRLKREMKSLLQEGRQSPPPCLGSRGKLGNQNQPAQNQTGSALPGRAPPADALTDEAREPAAPPPPPPPPVSAGEDRGCAGLPRPRTPLPALLQKSKPPASMFEDAGRALRRVQHHRKVLEENLEAILRAKNGEALNSQLEALCCNGDAKEVERIRKTVDAWIGALSKEVQAEVARGDSAAQRALEDNASLASLPVKSRRAKDAGSLKEATGSTQSRPRFGGKKSFLRGPQGQAQEAQPKSPVPPLKTKGPHQPRLFGAPRSEEEDEEYLMKVYGKALYSGHRRTLKKGPYLRFNSPSPKSKPQRPRVVESIKGVKVKSAKTQTRSSLFQDRRGRIDSEPQYLFSPTREGHNDPGAPQTPLEGLLIPMAIPLGQPRVDAGVPQPSRVIISRQPVTVTTSIPPTSQKAQPKRVSGPNVVVLELQSEEKRAAQLQVQVLPGVDIDSVSSSLSPTPSPPPPVRPPESQAIEGIAEEEETVYPGNDYSAVADIAQEPESVETHIELNGSPEPPIPMCHGPAYPAQPPRPAESILPVIQQRDALENRLVDWVEQQLMARMIAEMYHRPAPEARSSPSQPDESCSSASDIVEAAGGGGLQYFVDAGVPVDSALIRQYVTDTLSETVALMLGQRARERGPVSPPIPPDTAVPPEEVVPTPVPTPGSSPRGSDVQRTGESSRRTSPEPSERGSSIGSPPEIKPPEGQDPGPPAAERSPVATPNTTPVPTPPRVATPTAPPTPPSADLAELVNPWGGAELPLEEEVLHSESDDPLQDRKPVFMSVAKEEEPVSLVTVSPPPKQPSPPPHAQTPPLPPEAPPSASSVSSKSSSSSPSVTETDTVGRLISEGELLLSSGPIAAARVGGLTLPAFNTSLSSSLHGVLDIDYDPPSEGQVLRGPRVPHHRDPFLSLLARMDQGPLLLEEVAQHPEGSGEEGLSAGELSEGQGPEGPSLTPHPQLRDHSTFNHLTAAPPPEQGGLLSPGQLTLPAGMIPDNGHVDQNLASLTDLEALTVTQREPGDAEDQDTDSVAPAHGRAPILVRQYQEGAEDIEEPGALASTSLGQYRTVGMSVTLPSAGQDQAPASVELLETDSSENDGF